METTAYGYPMDRHTLTKAFTLTEMCLVILMVSALYCFASPFRMIEADPMQSFADTYLLGQSASIAVADKRTCIDESGDLPLITWNESGNVNRAMTLYSRNGNTQYVIELGTGRLVVR